ncbi:hypothetical protein MF672_010845 [Actinomadura sp. ATCC 31491]|uniref:CARDB domain-containing protein n=1 Tax=Actinomadura luzonensis TaxID=2805427 RepID=A0ABT0FPM6_9ACTN|nr:hypothetical protein [Actinomadura luzonensis]MCK2214284.1 hypothetical protein [Actinomadura luzonensis]
MQLKDMQGDHTREIPVAGQGTAATTDEWMGFKAPFRCVITGVVWVPNANVTADPTNYFSVVVKNRGAAGAGSTAIATRAYSATNGVAFTPETVSLSGTAADLNVAAGDWISVAKTVGGSGLAMPDGTVHVTFRAR